jgi:chromosome segregation protein
MIFLKKFIASGFKSFATKTEITFNETMSGIVGPNGSGKSNVVDAIK